MQAFPSLQVVPFALVTGAGQPVAGTHAATVWHWSAPPQVTVAPPVHTPVRQASPAVQALPSVQVLPSTLVTAAEQPVAGTHAATVWHWSAPVQVTAVPPVHAPV